MNIYDTHILPYYSTLWRFCSTAEKGKEIEFTAVISHAEYSEYLQ